MHRALIVRKEPLDLILDRKKIWELRLSGTSIRGHIGLVEKGTGLIAGTAELTKTVAMSPHEMARHWKKHRTSRKEIKKYANGGKKMHAWILMNAKRLQKPIPYRHPRGAVIWVKIPRLPKVTPPFKGRRF
ncbi:MAG: ASCH domain-containing protein [Parcubacteria group bacterium]|nr:ASCH domain-containing protein [Parcubacteria group bacterium]